MEKNATLLVDIEKLDMEAIAKEAQRWVLEDIFLDEAKIWRNPRIKLPKTLSLEHKCHTNFLWSEKGKIIFGKKLCNFQLAAFSAKAPDKLIMKIEASFCTSYAFNRDKTPAATEDFREEEGFVEEFEYRETIIPISDAWPYWREFVQSMSGRMGFPALTVPLLEIVPKKAATKEAKSPPAKKQSSRQKKVSA
jgi:hypothetical protein